VSKIWPSTTIIILTWNGVDYTRNCLESIKAYTRLNGQTQVMVVDNGSTDGTLPYLRQLDWITLVENGRNLGFVKGNNVGIQTAPPGNDILLLNNDTLIRQDKWLDEIQRVAYSADDVGIVGCRMVLGDGRLLHAGAYMPQDSFWGQQIGSLEKDVNQYALDREVTAVTGACFYIKRAVINTIGPLNEAFFSYFEDTDYCLQAAKAGFRTMCAGNVTIVHFENVSTNLNRVSFSKLFRKSQKTFRKQWEDELMTRFETAVLWQSAVGNPSGYAVSAREMLLQLDALDVDVRLAYLYGTDWMDTQRDDHRLAAMRQRPKDLHLPQVVYASGDLFCKNSGRYRIGYTMLEVDGIPKDWILQANELDEVWVPSSFNKQTFLESGLKVPIHVMPLGVNPDFYNTKIRPYRPTDRFTFLAVFEWGERKGAELLLRAYHRAFGQKDDVLLLAKVINTDGGVNVQKEVKALNLPENGPPVAILYNQDLPTHQMGSLYRSADCLVAPSRGEGWGMPHIEAMACGLPVIATDWSAPTDFMNESIAYPLQIAKLIPAVAKCPYYEGFRWAEPDEDHLVHLLRHVYENRAEAAEKGQRASAEVLSKWTWRHAAEKIKARLQEINA
jgi:GT2 family glycosyltransferase/glycosyltransferase involved in cell wall biosynthesis